MKKLSHLLPSIVAVVIFLEFSVGSVQAGPCELPVFNADNFDSNPNSPTYSANITNPYMPLKVGIMFTYEPVPNPDNVVNPVIVEDIIKTITVDGTSVDCRQVHDYETDGGVLAEDTFDWYAQDLDGNVWYCGEDTTVFLPGGGTDKTGSWEAGKDVAHIGVTALPGYVMLADPAPGVCYQQESYPGQAEDDAKVMRLNATLTLESNGNGYENCLETKEGSTLELGAIEQKFYAKGVGLVLNFEHHGKRVRNELISVTHASAI
jgi:hypothetical protein